MTIFDSLPARSIAFSSAFVILSASRPGAAPLTLESPVDCAIGTDCYVQSHVDRDGGPGAVDFTCGTLTYDGHKGTDIRVATLADMARGVAVLAAAAGTVRGVRDGEPDTGAEAAAKGRECGNGVVIDHGDGWETQYCHLARGSIAVRAGTRVAPGALLGRIGLSGDTGFPHLHLSVRRGGVPVDPFDARPQAGVCGKAGGETLWSDTAATAFTYRPGGVVDAGFAPGPVALEDVRAGVVATAAQGGDPLVFWSRAFGLRAGDRFRIRLTGPDGGLLAEQFKEVQRPRAEQMIFAGRRAPTGGWPTGVYHGQAILHRNGGVVDQLTLEWTRP